ncbi:MAG: DUF2304 domain-containing protein [Anaerolineae bacterium]|nr:DUF2304 domain-containing protein [Anaerolineae bacterium]
MIDRVTVFGLIASVFGLVFVLELVRRRKLREDYSLLWLATAASLIALTLSRPLLDQIAAFLGIVTYPPAALFLVAIMFMLVILLHYATVLTRLARENKQMAQKMAILQWELEQTRRGGDSPASGAGEVTPRGS